MTGLRDVKELTDASRKLLARAEAMNTKAKSMPAGPDRDDLERGARELIEEARRLAELANRMVKSQRAAT